MLTNLFSDLKTQRYTNADMKIYWYHRLQQKKNMPKVSHHNTVYFWRYAHPRYKKCLFRNIQKKKNMLKRSLIFWKNQRYITQGFLGLWMQNFQGIFYMNQIWVSVPLVASSNNFEKEGERERKRDILKKYLYKNIFSFFI